MPNSKGDGGPGDPFGFLRLKRGGTALSLYVLPYNYPALFRLLTSFQGLPAAARRAGPSPAWRAELERYFASVPAYYHAQLKVGREVTPRCIATARHAVIMCYASS